MKKNKPIIAIYSRKSKFTGKGESIGNQIELCKTYIRANYGDEYAESAVVYEDEGFSGGNLNRPDFKKMMKAAHDRQFQAIVVYRLDRISRNISDFSHLIEELGQLDIAFVSIKEQFDTGTPMGRAMMYIASVFSQLERETIAERIRDNMHELAKTGRWLGGTTPTGYVSQSVKSVTVDGKTKKACKLKPVPEEADLIRKIFDLFIETDSLTQVEAELIRQNVRTRRGIEFSRFSIKNILQNPVYMIADETAYDYFIQNEADLFSDRSEFDGVHGILAYNRTDQAKGKTTILNPINEWIVSVGQHPGIISSKQWIQVQHALERNRSKCFRKPRSNEALLTGLLFCRCGGRMYPKLTKRKLPDGKPVFAYVCKEKERSQRTLCDRRNVNGNTLDAAVMEQIKQIAEDKNGILSLIEQSRKFYTGNREEYDTQLAELKAKQVENERKINGLLDTLLTMEESGSKKQITRRIDELNRENDSIAARITELEGLTEESVLSPDEFDLMRQLLSTFQLGIDDMSIGQQRAAIRTLVRKIIWDGEYAHIFLFGAGEDEIEFPDLTDRFASEGEMEEEEPLVEYTDVNYDENVALLSPLSENSK